jgi:hypothetical protein
MSPAAEFIAAVGGCDLSSAGAVPIVCPVAPGVGPEPASLPPVLQGPACAVPTLKTVAAIAAKITLFLVMPLLAILRNSVCGPPPSGFGSPA